MRPVDSARDVRSHVGRDVSAGVDVRHVERHAVAVDRHRREAGRQQVLHVDAVEDGSTTGSDETCSWRLKARLRGSGRRRWPAISIWPSSLGRRVEEQVAVFRVATRAPGLEHVLHGDADLAFHAADRLLQGPREERIGRSTRTGNCSLLSV